MPVVLRFSAKNPVEAAGAANFHTWMTRQLSEAVQYINSKWPWWGRLQGARHIFIQPGGDVWALERRGLFKR